jgi:copper(I)-binding protein
LLTLVVLVVVCLLGASCSGDEAAPSAGPTTGSSRPDLDSVEGEVGDLRLLHVYIASPGQRGSPHDPGDGADLLLTVANDGTAADVLSGASGDAAEQVVFRDGDLTATSPPHVAAPAGGVASLQDVSGPHLELSGLTQELRSGGSVPVTFTFATAGSVTLQVPVATYDPAAATSTSAAPP